MNRRNPAYTVEKLLISPAIYVDVTFSDGKKVGPHDYHKNDARNVIFDVCADEQLRQCTGGDTNDPNALIKVVYWDVDSKNKKLGKFAGQLTSTGNDAGTAYLKVSLRDNPKITDSVKVEVVSTPEPDSQPGPEPQQPPLVKAPSAPAAIPHGALALDLETYNPGLSNNHASRDAANSAALSLCGSANCKIMRNFSGLGCASYVLSKGEAFGWAVHPGGKAQAENDAVAQCRGQGGKNCIVMKTACNSEVVASDVTRPPAGLRK